MSNAFNRPLAQLRIRLATRAALLNSGKVRSWSEANAVVSEINTETIGQAVEMVQANPQAFGVRGQSFTAGIRKLGDGGLIDKILEFLQSPLGQALIQALMKLLLGGLLGESEVQDEGQGQPQAMTADVESVMTNILGRPPMPAGVAMPANVDWEKVKEGLRRWLPMLKLIAMTTNNKYDDAVVQFLETLLSSGQ